MTPHYPTHSKPAPLPEAIKRLPAAQRLAYLYITRRKDARKLEFSESWNGRNRTGGKLACSSFSTLRGTRLLKGQWVRVYLAGQYLGDAIVVASRQVLGDHLTDAECYLDTGYNKLETLEILARMYSISVTQAAAREWTLATLVYIDATTIDSVQNELFDPAP